MKYATADVIIKRIKVNKNAMNAMVIRSHHVENEGIGGGANTFEETGA
jgi:hypothetical protein